MPSPVVALVPRGPRSLLVDVVIDGEPRPMSRPRVTRHSTYTPATARHAKSAVQMYLRAKITVPTRQEVAVEVDFYLGNRRKCDIDNLWKLVSDAGNGVVWNDDTQIVEVLMRKRVDRANPRTEMRVWKISEESEDK